VIYWLSELLLVSVVIMVCYPKVSPISPRGDEETLPLAGKKDLSWNHIMDDGIIHCREPQAKMVCFARLLSRQFVGGGVPYCPGCTSSVLCRSKEQDYGLTQGECYL